MSLEEYVDRVLENPTAAASGARYLLAAVESQGTREVRERGERLERYRFFDDPFNDGEHAVLGNTAALNAFVDDLRAAAAGGQRRRRRSWIDGPTATGKSEFKRCLERPSEFSTEAGRRYRRVERHRGRDRKRGRGQAGAASLSYGDGGDAAAWYRSPVQTHPSGVPRSGPGVDRRRRRRRRPTPIAADVDLDPFSREAYDHLESVYRDEGRRDLFSAITDRDHLRVTSYVVDVGEGVGVLHAEDDGSPKERLVGSWMGGMLRELDSRGRKNPQAFSYDGVLSQGNGVATIVEDASQHADLLRRLLNVPDERRVKLDKGIGMDLDTQLIVISNPPTRRRTRPPCRARRADPLKALKRRSLATTSSATSRTGGWRQSCCAARSAAREAYRRSTGSRTTSRSIPAKIPRGTPRASPVPASLTIGVRDGDKKGSRSANSLPTRSERPRCTRSSRGSTPTTCRRGSTSSRRPSCTKKR